MLNNLRQMLADERDDAYIKWARVKILELATIFADDVEGEMPEDSLQFFKDGVADVLGPIAIMVEMLNEISEDGKKTIRYKSLKGLLVGLAVYIPKMIQEVEPDTARQKMRAVATMIYEGLVIKH